jgi:hypothetical protein
MRRRASDTVSAALRAVAECDPAAEVVRQALLRPPEKWCHGMDSLKILKAIPPEEFAKFFGVNGFPQLLNVLIHFALIMNETVSKKSKRRATKLVDNLNCEAANRTELQSHRFV